MNLKMEQQIRDGQEALIDQYLARQQEPQIPAGFAARVVASLPPAPAPRRMPSLARVSALTAAVVLVLASFVIAPHAAPRLHSAAFDLELLVVAQLAAIAAWLVTQRHA